MRHEVESSNSRRLAALTGAMETYCAVDGGKLEDPAVRDKILSNMMAPKEVVLKVDAQVCNIPRAHRFALEHSLGLVGLVIR